MVSIKIRSVFYYLIFLVLGRVIWNVSEISHAGLPAECTVGFRSLFSMNNYDNLLFILWLLGKNKLYFGTTCVLWGMLFPTVCTLKIAGYYFGMILAGATEEKMIHFACNVSSPPLAALLMLEHIFSWMNNIRMQTFLLTYIKKNLTKYKKHNHIHERH